MGLQFLGSYDQFGEKLKSFLSSKGIGCMNQLSVLKLEGDRVPAIKISISVHLLTIYENS